MTILPFTFARILRPLTLFICTMAIPLAAAAADEALMVEGDSHWAKRSDGAVGEVAKPAEVDVAIDVYRRALGAEPANLEVRWRLLRALYFRGLNCGAGEAERKTFFGDAKKVGDTGVAQLEKSIGEAKGKARTDGLKKIPAAAPIYLWTAACWGEWALAYGKLAAAREGAASTIRDLAQTVIDVDPAYEEGGGYRVLGRLHHQSPKIPFITGWVSRDDAMANLRKAIAAGPKSRGNQFFLAEAILDYESSRTAEAKELLTRCANDPLRDELRVEEANYAGQAKKRLSGIR